MRSQFRVAATSMATALIASSLLASPLLAAPKGGGGGGTTTTTAFSGTFTAKPQGTIVVGSPTRVTFSYSWKNGAGKSIRLAVPSSYAKPQVDNEFDATTGENVGFVSTTSGDSCVSAPRIDAATASVIVDISTATSCANSSAPFTFDYIAQTAVTGGAKFSIYVGTTLYTSLTLNASSAKVAVTSITKDGAAVTTANAGETVRVMFKVTDTKSRTLTGVQLAISDSGAGTITPGPCAFVVTEGDTCTDGNGVAYADILVEGVGQHQVRAVVPGTSYSGQKSFTASAGALAALVLSTEGGDLPAAEPATIDVEGFDAYDNHVDLLDADVEWLTDELDGGTNHIDLGTPSANLDGTVSVTITGDQTGGVTVTASAGDGVTPDSAVFTIVPGTPATLTLVGDETALTLGDARDLTVAAVDGAGNAVTLTTGDVSWSATPSTNASFTDETANEDGSVTVTVTGDEVGDGVEVTASAGTGDDSVAFDITAGTLTGLAVLGGGGDLTAGATRTLTVVGVNEFGKQFTLTATTIDWTTGESEATFVTLAPSGDSVDVTGELTGGVTVSVSVGEFSANTSLTVVAGALATLEASVTDVSLASDGAASVTITGRDVKGNAVALAAADFDVTTGSGGDAFATPSLADGADGTLTLTVTGLADGSGTITVFDRDVQTIDVDVTFTVTTPTP